MRHFAVVGSGPAGFYTAEALEKAYGDAEGLGPASTSSTGIPFPTA